MATDYDVTLPEHLRRSVDSKILNRPDPEPTVTVSLARLLVREAYAAGRDELLERAERAEAERDDFRARMIDAQRGYHEAVYGRGRVETQNETTQSCPTCRGTRRVPGGFVVGGRRTSMTCPECGGSGVTQNETTQPQVLTMNPVLPEEF